MGRYIASELGRRPEVTSVSVASRSSAGAEAVARLLGGPSDRVRPVTVDVTDGDAALEPFAQADVVVSAAGPAYLTERAAVALAARSGTPYVSLADDLACASDVLDLSDEAARSGATVVSGCGLSPGISNLLIDLCARRLDQVEEIEISLARSSAESDGPASVMHFLFEMTQPATVISDYNISQERSGTGPRLVYFPEPVGWVETFHIGHPEVVTLPRRFDSIRSLRFRVGLTEKAAMDVARAAAASGLVRSESGRRFFLKASNPLRPLIERMPPRGAAWTALRIDVHGQKDDRIETISYGAVDHLRNFAAVPISVLAVKLGSREIQNPGVHPVEDVVDTGAFLAEIAQRGVRVARLESERV
jgi:saccharopine dehydrogenase (NAD+, L-lysine-forming)